MSNESPFQDADDFMSTWLLRITRFQEKVMVFIDAGYFRKCMEEKFHRTDIDLTKIVMKLLRGRQLLRVYYYTAEITKTPNTHWRNIKSEQQKTFTALSHIPYIEIRKGRLNLSDPNNAHQKGVDVLIALDMLRFALKKNYDTAILLSGDGDFTDIVRMIKDEGQKVEIATFPGTCARTLYEICDTQIEIDSDYISGCWLEARNNERVSE